MTKRRFAHWCMTLRELLELLDEAGFELAELLESVDGESYELGSPRLLLIATRR